MDKTPFDLSLDEIIALNKSRNVENEIDMEMVNSTGVDLEHNIGYPTSLSKEILDQRLRSTPGFGSKPIHHRLGYIDDNLRKIRKETTFKNNHAQSILKRVKTFYHRKMPTNPVVKIANQYAFFKSPYLPLTKKSIKQFNKETNGYVSKANGSNQSTFSTHVPQMRHSIKASLNRGTQAEIKALTAEHVVELDFGMLVNFKIPPNLPSVTTNTRLGLYF